MFLELKYSASSNLSSDAYKLLSFNFSQFGLNELTAANQARTTAAALRLHEQQQKRPSFSTGTYFTTNVMLPVMKHILSQMGLGLIIGFLSFPDPRLQSTVAGSYLTTITGLSHLTASQSWCQAPARDQKVAI